MINQQHHARGHSWTLCFVLRTGRWCGGRPESLLVTKKTDSPSNSRCPYPSVVFTEGYDRGLNPSIPGPHPPLYRGVASHWRLRLKREPGRGVVDGVPCARCEEVQTNIKRQDATHPKSQPWSISSKHLPSLHFSFDSLDPPLFDPQSF